MLRDAGLLGQMLVAVNQGQKQLLQAVHEYEVEMLRYSSEAVNESRKQMNSTDAIHKPAIGRSQLAQIRGAMHVINLAHR